MRVLVVLCGVVALAAARMAYFFPSGYEDLVGEVSQSFSCDGRPYGYYADVDNACRVFHVCLPIQDDLGQTSAVDQFTFVCPNQTVFNQESLTCTSAEDAFPCQQAASLYDLVNSEFGRITQDDLE
ncbi:U-scoloptoxin(01)-Cw1a [Procambarus clarkii]|uniref:U-scoloptoxin(01)-Cw1a n=1 Tax=Procambarus clarkii TaxID=6728 RepID=UPI001E6715F9|nr:U-scoloptoxin(01)-Cw1a-like [Procambarus clarkii]